MPESDVVFQLALLILLSTVGAASETVPPQVRTGIIQGVVVDGTNSQEPLEDIDVVLRADADGQLVPVAGTKTDRYGKFSFLDVPLDPGVVYLPGANRQGVHYPGRRVRLNVDARVAHVRIETFAAQTGLCPLVAKRHELVVEVEERALKVSEKLIVSNPTRSTYLGQSMAGGAPVTFWLSIPKAFDRVTFDKEFFGRRFLIVEHQPVTDIPWLPGNQQLSFSYHVPLVEEEGSFQRPLDVPTEAVSITVRGAIADQIVCNLPLIHRANGEAKFASTGKSLPQSFVLELAIRSLPFPWMQYARWVALATLVALTVSTLIVRRMRGRRSAARERQSRRAA